MPPDMDPAREGAERDLAAYVCEMHIASPSFGTEYCVKDAQQWPCDAIQLAAELAEARAARAVAEQERDTLRTAIDAAWERTKATFAPPTAPPEVGQNG